MKLSEIIKDKEYPLIEERIIGKLPDGTEYNTLSGKFGYIHGEIIPWDGDVYSMSYEYERFEEFTLNKSITLCTPLFYKDKHEMTVPEGTRCLIVWYRADNEEEA